MRASSSRGSPPKTPTSACPPRIAANRSRLAEIALLKKWIEEGAAYEGHWAFEPPVRPALPLVKNRDWCRNPIDFFILAKLEANGLEPSPEAACAHAAEARESRPGRPSAFGRAGRCVSGRRSARSAIRGRLTGCWLPHITVSGGAGSGSTPPATPIPTGTRKTSRARCTSTATGSSSALNRDLPYNEFIIDQIAGDLRAGATPEQLTATGFLRNSMINEEGGIDPEQFRMEAMYDRMDCVGKAILGLTIQCAQCHDHKYDPLTQEDYYRMFAFLNNAHEANISVYTRSQRQRIAQIERQTREIEELIKHQNPDWPERMAAWEKPVSTGEPEWVVVQPHVDEESTGGQKYLPIEDGSFLAQGYAPTKHTVEMSVKTTIAPIRAVRLELLNDPNLPLSGPGRSIKGTGALDRDQRSRPRRLTARARPFDVKFSGATADVNPPETPLDAIFDDHSKRKRVTGPVGFAIDGKDETAWGIDIGPERRNHPCKAVFTLEKPIEFPGGAVITFNLKQNHGGWNSDDNQNHNLGRFRLSMTTAADAKADPVPVRVRQILAITAEKPQPQSKPLWSSVTGERPCPSGTVRTTGSSRSSGSIRKGRRNWCCASVKSPGSRTSCSGAIFSSRCRAVSPGVPAFLKAAGRSSSTPSRLTFARWLASRDSPTTARSLVNRVWQAYFGTGIVATSEDLGVQCDPPSHPELLDWLAVEFMESGWSLKHLHRLIASSATYRQSSRVTAPLLARDPYNRLLARGPRFRVDAELVRDIALAASGLLDAKIGGPSVCPPAPAFLFQPPVSYGPKVWNEAIGIERYRRALLHVPLSLGPLSDASGL